MSDTPRRIIRLPALLEKLGGISSATFHRRYRRNPEAPQPIALPDAQLAFWEHEWDEFLANLGRKAPTDWKETPRHRPRKSSRPTAA